MDWNNYMRDVCVEAFLKNPSLIRGSGLTTEIDKSLFYKKKNNVGHILSEQWIFRGICQKNMWMLPYC